ncbi:caspase-1-like isoform X2 [Artibeus jamaicensis]|uniref:caspase-1-like isoform X2 n=1 Tax=Artibeus jamaicensis TaxID=9417 RepID=UPI00235ADA91|nr:caspase-1-like isoform X2 [Artibeus jamaicensis]
MADKRLNEKRKIFVDSVSEDTLNNLLDDVLNEKVLNREESEKVKKGNVTTIAKARDLIDFVIPKGPVASQIFIDYICKRDSTLASKLGFSPEVPVQRESESKDSIDQLILCPHEKFLELCQKEAGMIYPIREKEGRTRLALIICNTKFDHLPRRNGSNHDIIGMKGLLENLGYSVHVEENLTAREMESVLEAFAARPEHKSSDSTFLVFMSHGILDRICGTLHNNDKSDVLHYDTIFQTFNNRNCCHLKDKPKVIIIQACRGDNISWRRESGSLFITQLIHYVKKYSWCCHLTEIFVMVQRSFEEPGVKAQMPTLERQTMTRYFYLFPGN